MLQEVSEPFDLLTFDFTEKLTSLEGTAEVSSLRSHIEPQGYYRPVPDFYGSALAHSMAGALQFLPGHQKGQTLHLK